MQFCDKLTQLEELLKTHDWGYDFYDDMNRWNKGNEERKCIDSMILKCLQSGFKKEEVVSLINEYQPKLY